MEITFFCFFSGRTITENNTERQIMFSGHTVTEYKTEYVSQCPGRICYQLRASTRDINNIGWRQSNIILLLLFDEADDSLKLAVKKNLL